MSPLTLRLVLFFFGCILVRFLITAAAWAAPLSLLRWLGYAALVPAIGWFYLIFIGSRDTGPEVMGGRIWWQNLRPVHMLLWGFFAYLAIHENRNAWIVLLCDTLFGLGAGLHHHRAALGARTS